MNKAEKTKEKLANSLIELLERKPIDLISVKELCQKANVGRTAYYNHFKSVDDVLKYIYRKAHTKIFEDKYKNPYYLVSDEHFKDMISFFDDNSRLLSVIIKWQIIDIIAKYNTELVLSYVEQYEDPIIRKNAFYYTCYTGVTIFNMCGLWVANGKKESKEEFFELIKYFDELKKGCNK